MTLSVVIITYNEEANLPRTLESLMPLVRDGKGEIILVDSGSTDRTVEIAKSFGATVFVEKWKGYAGQKNSAIEKASGDWILSLDADESLDSGLAGEIFAASEGRGSSELQNLAQGNSLERTEAALAAQESQKKGHGAYPNGFWIDRKNYFLGRFLRHGGFWPDPKLRLFRKGAARFQDRLVHEDAKLVAGTTGKLKHALLHHSYPTLSDYIDHMNRYSSLGAEMVTQQRFSSLNIVGRPLATFIYNYFFRLGFLDGREGLVLHLYHAVYVSWKYAKAWELGRMRGK